MFIFAYLVLGAFIVLGLPFANEKLKPSTPKQINLLANGYLASALFLIALMGIAIFSFPPNACDMGYIIYAFVLSIPIVFSFFIRKAYLDGNLDNGNFEPQLALAIVMLLFGCGGISITYMQEDVRKVDAQAAIVQAIENSEDAIRMLESQDRLDTAISHVESLAQKDERKTVERIAENGKTDGRPKIFKNWREQQR